MTPGVHRLHKKSGHWKNNQSKLRQGNPQTSMEVTSASVHGQSLCNTLPGSGVLEDVYVHVPFASPPANICSKPLHPSSDSSPPRNALTKLAPNSCCTAL